MKVILEPLTKEARELLIKWIVQKRGAKEPIETYVSPSGRRLLEIDDSKLESFGEELKSLTGGGDKQVRISDFRRWTPQNRVEPVKV